MINDNEQTNVMRLTLELQCQRDIEVSVMTVLSVNDLTFYLQVLVLVNVSCPLII